MRSRKGLSSWYGGAGVAVDGVENCGGAVEVDTLERGDGATLSSTTLLACNNAFLSPIMSIGISASDIVGPDALSAAVSAPAGAKGTKAGLWYDKRRTRGRNALFTAAMRSGSLPGAPGVAVSWAFGGAKGTMRGLWRDS